MLKNWMKSVLFHILPGAPALFLYNAASSVFFGDIVAAGGKLFWFEAFRWGLFLSALLVFFFLGKAFLERRSSRLQTVRSIAAAPALGAVFWLLAFIASKGGEGPAWMLCFVYNAYAAPVAMDSFLGKNALLTLAFSFVPFFAMLFGALSKKKRF